MPKPAATFVTVVFASLLAGVPVVAISFSAARAADDCLAAPTDPTPQGSHWYYRTDRATQRDCWYLRQARPGPMPAVPQNALPIAKLIAPQAFTTAPGSMADARAEIQASPPPEQAQTHPDEPATMPPQTTSNTASEENTVPKPTASETHRSMLMAALALAGILGSIIFKLGSPRRSRRAKLRKRRSDIWATADQGRRTAPAYPHADDFRRLPDFALDLDRASDLKARSREIFSQLSKEAPP